MYYIPLLINNRRWFVAPFTTNEAEVKNTHFVIPLNVNGSTHLISVEKDLGEVFSDNVANIPFDELTWGDADIELIEQPKGDEGEKGKANLSIEFEGIHYLFERVNDTDEDDGNRFGLDYNLTNPRDGKHKVHLVLKVGNETYRSSITFHFSMAQNSYEAVLDFGSESSQMSFKRHSESEPKQVDILHELVSFNPDWKDQYENIGQSRTEFLQNDTDRRYFYKSRFRFAHESNINGEEIKHRIVINPDSPEFSNAPFAEKAEAVLIAETKSDYLKIKGFRMPNLKILELYPDVFDDIMVNTLSQNRANEVLGILSTIKQMSFKDVRPLVLREIKSNFAYVLFKALSDYIINSDNQFEASDHRTLHFKLLVPNIYDYESSLKLLYEFSKDMNSILKEGEVIISDTQVKINKLIDAFEVSILSESDASFLGAKSVNDDLKNAVENLNNKKGKIALIDCGKGTTDISIIKVVDGRPVSQFRGGFAGAGNYLTFAFVKSILKATKIQDSSELKAVLKKVLEEKDSIKDLFVDAAEKLKRFYKDGNGLLALDKYKVLDTFLEDWNILDDELDLGELARELEKIDSRKIIDGYGIVDSHINNLSQLILEEIKKSNIQLKEIKHFILTGRGFLLDDFKQNVIKTICGERDKGTILPPIKSDPKKLFPDFQNIESKLKEICLHGSFSKSNMQQTDNPTFDINIVKSGLSIAGIKLLKDRKQKISSMEYVLQEGLDIKITNSTQGEIEIGNKTYSFNMQDVDGELTLYFIGNAYNSNMPYLLKSGNEVIKLEKQHKHSQDEGDQQEFVAKTMFPYIGVKYLDHLGGSGLTDIGGFGPTDQTFTL